MYFSFSDQVCNVDIFSNEANIGAVGSFRRFRMSKQPLISCPKQAIFPAYLREHRLIRVGSLGQRHQNPETLIGVSVARRIMKCGRIAFYHHTGRHPESLDLCSIQYTILNLALLGKKQYEVFCTQIEFAVSVVFQTIELGVMAVTPAKLHRHTAIEMLRNLDHGRQFL